LIHFFLPLSYSFSINLITIILKKASMTLTVQEISDRFEIMDLLNDYCSAIDTKDIDALDSIFTTNAQIDFSRAGGPRSDLTTIKNFLKENLGDLPRQHLISNFKIKIQGNQADIRCLCFNPLELPNDKNGLQIMLWGIWYHDKAIRTPHGWRIQEKATYPCYNWKIQRT
jgi:SnoaL-like domain